MIPINIEEEVLHKDSESGVVYSLKPMCGASEYKVQEILKKKGAADNSDTIKTMEMTDAIFDMFVVGWSHPEMEIPEFPEDGKPSKMFQMKDKNKMVFDVILNLAKGLTKEEKKS